MTPSLCSSTGSPVCPVCHNTTDCLYVCPPHDAGKCYTCLMSCEEFHAWSDMVRRLDMVPGALDVKIWAPLLRIHGQRVDKDPE